MNCPNRAAQLNAPSKTMMRATARSPRLSMARPIAYQKKKSSSCFR